MKLSSETNTQRQRILEYLQTHRAMSTFTARLVLDVPHPAGRVQELKARGHNIITHRRQADTEMGSHKAVAEYILMATNHEAIQ